MNIALFSQDGLFFLLRWLHLFFGVVWIGHLYYFNFTQGGYMAVADGPSKVSLQSKLLPIALWWFRWGAMWTFVTGLLYLMLKGHFAHGFAVFGTGWGVAILTGAALGTLMFLNVWLIIWPKQQIVIKSAEQVAKGGAALPEAAPAAAKAGLASRTNTLFSIPMLFFMGAASHLPLTVTPESHLGLLAVIVAVILGALELNAIKGKQGPMTSVKGVVHMSVFLAVVLYAVVEACL